MASGSFAQIRSKLRALETRTESLLSNYSGYTQSVSSSATEDEIKVIKELEECLDQVSTMAGVYEFIANAV